MMKIFGITFGRKTPASSQQPKGHKQAETTSPASMTGAMAANLSADMLMPETRSLLHTLSGKIGMPSSDASIRQNDQKTASAFDDTPFSDSMKALLNDLSKRLFPHRHATNETAIDTGALLEKLRGDLKNLTPKEISEITPPDHAQEMAAIDAPLDDIARDILARAGLDAASSPDTVSDTASGTSADKAGSQVSGDTKPEHATKEALSNPFSLVNINRGAASAIPIAPGMDDADNNMDQAAGDSRKKRSSRRKKPVERSTVNYKKKLQQTRFSRRRFLREYGGNTILGAIFSFLLLIGFTVGTIVTNVSVIIPQTRINQDAGKQSEAFRNEIDRNQPKLSSLLKRRQDLEERLTTLTNNFVNVNQIRDDFTAFLNILDQDERVTVSEQTIEAIENELPNIEAISVTFRLETSFLLWLKYRNQMIRKYEDINVVEETITAPPGVSTVQIYIKMSRPGRST